MRTCKSTGHPRQWREPARTNMLPKEKNDVGLSRELRAREYLLRYSLQYTGFLSGESWIPRPCGFHALGATITGDASPYVPYRDSNWLDCASQSHSSNLGISLVLKASESARVSLSSGRRLCPLGHVNTALGTYCIRLSCPFIKLHLIK